MRITTIVAGLTCLLLGFVALPGRSAAPARTIAVVAGITGGTLPRETLEANRKAVLEAVEADLKKHDYVLTPRDKVQSALKELEFNLDEKRLSAPAMSQVRTRLGTDLLVYFSGRYGGDTDDGKGFRSVVLLNVVSPATEKQFYHTNQSHADFLQDAGKPGAPLPKEKVIIDGVTAARLAGDLLRDFYAKQKR